MANIRLSRTVYKKDEFDKSIDSSFKSFVDVVEVDNDTIEEFFRLYNKLFYEIPAEGEFNSHEFIIKESSKLVDFETDDEAIQPLLDEITDLRQRLLEQNAENIETENDMIQALGKTEGINLEENLKSLQTKINLTKEQINTPATPAPKPKQEVASIEIEKRSPFKIVKKNQPWAAVRNRKLELERKGLTRKEIRDGLIKFGASKAQIARVL